MSSTPQEILNEKLKQEFDMTYSENDLLTEFCEEFGIILTPETIDNYNEEDFEDFKESKFEEYKEMRLN